MKRAHILSLLILGLALAGGCGDPSGGNNSDAPQVAGRIQNWTQGSGYTVLVTMGDRQHPTTVALSEISSVGDFNLTLPGAALVTPLLSATGALWDPLPGCGGSLTVSPATARGGLANFVAAIDHTILYMGYVSGPAPTSGNTDLTGASWLYSEEDATVSGMLTCGGPKLIGTLDATLTLHQGWNAVDFHLTGGPANGGAAVYGSESLTSGPPPSNLSWIVNPNLN
jgi:hypothetical protein